MSVSEMSPEQVKLNGRTDALSELKSGHEVLLRMGVEGYTGVVRHYGDAETPALIELLDPIGGTGDFVFGDGEWTVGSGSIVALYRVGDHWEPFDYSDVIEVFPNGSPRNPLEPFEVFRV